MSPSFVQVLELNVGAAAADELLPRDNITIDSRLVEAMQEIFANVHKPENDSRWNKNMNVYIKIESCRIF